MVRRMSWTPDCWNTCPKCKGYIDAPEVFDGDEVHCDECGARFVVIVFTEGDPLLSEVEPDPPSEDDAAEYACPDCGKDSRVGHEGMGD